MADKIIIESKRTFGGIGFKELYNYKDLFVTLVWRDFKIRYSQTAIGVLWGVLQPLFTITILALVFGRFIKVNTGGVPHTLFIMTGLCAWQYFSFVLVNSGNSIISSQQLVKKVYFPRLIIPLSKASLGLIDMLIYLGILLVLMIYYKVVPPAQIALLPLFIVLNIIASVGVGIWLSALSIRFRDSQFIVPILIQLGLYITPVAYPVEFVLKSLPKWAAGLYFLNPMAGIIQGYRWCLLDSAPPSSLSYISFAIVGVIFITGLMYFRRVEDVLSDII